VGSIAYVRRYPLCDFRDLMHQSKPVEAHYDARTMFGSWAYMCDHCYEAFGLGQLGTGYGQRLIVKQSEE
jgi:hypothetical protein